MNLKTISALKLFPDRLEQFFYAIPECSRQWVPESWEGIPSESFSAIEQICHVRDVEIDGYHIRFRRMLAETEPALDSLDGYGLVQGKNYKNCDPESVFKDIWSARTESLQLIDSLTENQLARVGYFEGYGRITMKGLVHYLCSHDQQHLAGLQWLLGKIESNA